MKIEGLVDRGGETGNLLDMQRSILSEPRRMLHRVVSAHVGYETAGDVLFRVDQVSRSLDVAAKTLQELNLRLLMFGIAEFSAEEAKPIGDGRYSLNGLEGVSGRFAKTSSATSRKCGATAMRNVGKRLRGWMSARGVCPTDAARSLSGGAYSEFGDFANLMKVTEHVWPGVGIGCFGAALPQERRCQKTE